MRVANAQLTFLLNVLTAFQRRATSEPVEPWGICVCVCVCRDVCLQQHPGFRISCASPCQRHLANKSVHTYIYIYIISNVPTATHILLSISLFRFLKNNNKNMFFHYVFLFVVLIKQLYNIFFQL